jgi:dUTP pyrophosphatase
MYQTKFSAGLDLCSQEDVRITTGRRAIVDTGVYLKDVMPTDFIYIERKGTDVVPYAMVCSRSGLAAKEGIAVLNAPGIVDADYADTIKVILINHGHYPVQIKKGDRIAQLVFSFAYRRTDLVKDEERTSGLGSTGQ